MITTSRRQLLATTGLLALGGAIPAGCSRIAGGGEALAVGNEQRQHCKHLRLEVHWLAFRSKLDGGEVQLEVGEAIEHARLG